MEGNLISGEAQGVAFAAPKTGTSAQFELSKSKYHRQIAEQMEQRAKSGRIFGKSWKSFLGFFAPFGPENSFWCRLQRSPTFKHLFLFDDKSVDSVQETALNEVADVARVTVSDVDAAVNTSALVCALLLSVPCTVMSSVSGDPDAWHRFLNGEMDKNTGTLCAPPYSDFCKKQLNYSISFLYKNIMICFYASLCTLCTAIFYYMCRPSESCNNSSLNTLFEAFTLEIRQKIRKERFKQRDATSDFTEVPPEEPFGSPIEEIEVFMKAKFFAENEMEEQKNQEFYMWYRSKICV
jgi:hypothetical protein